MYAWPHMHKYCSKKITKLTGTVNWCTALLDFLPIVVACILFVCGLGNFRKKKCLLRLKPSKVRCIMSTLFSFHCCLVYILDQLWMTADGSGCWCLKVCVCWPFHCLREHSTWAMPRRQGGRFGEVAHGYDVPRHRSCRWQLLLVVLQNLLGPDGLCRLGNQNRFRDFPHFCMPFAKLTWLCGTSTIWRLWPSGNDEFDFQVSLPEGTLCPEVAITQVMPRLFPGTPAMSHRLVHGTL